MFTLFNTKGNIHSGPEHLKTKNIPALLIPMLPAASLIPGCDTPPG